MDEANDSEAMEYLERLPNEESFTMKSLPSDKSKTYTKLEPSKNFSCIYIHENTLYLGIDFYNNKGTKNSQVYVYEIRLNQEYHKNEDDDFLLKEIKIITPHCKVVSMIRANEDYFVTVPETDDECFISVWSAETQNFLVCLEGHKSQVSSIVFMQNQNYLVSASWDATLRIWNLEQLSSLKPYKTFKGIYPILVIKEFNDEVLILGGDDCYLVLWNWKKGEVIKKEFGHAGSVTYIDIMGEYVFTSGGDNKFRFWEVLVAESTETSIKSQEIDFREKYKIKRVTEHKEEYDPIVFGTNYHNYLIVIDKRGDVFLFTEDMEIYKMGNYFDENEEISGVDVYGDFVMVTTTKGVLKHINMKKEFNKMTCSIKTKRTIPSSTNIIQIDSNFPLERDKTRNLSECEKSKREKSEIESIGERLKNLSSNENKSDRSEN